MRPLKYYETFRFKVVVSITLVHVVLMLMLVGSVIRREERTMDDVMIANAHSIARMVAIAARNAVLTENIGTLQEIVRYAVQQSGVRRVRVSNAQGVTLGGSGPDRIARRWLTVSNGIDVGRYRVGTVVLSLSRAQVARQVAAARDYGLLFTVLALLVGGGAGWLISRNLTRDLDGLVRDVQRVGNSDNDRAIGVRRHNEVGVLSEAFNAMLARLARASRQMEVERRKQAESERLACLAETAAAIVHEIRNPLASIVNGVELLVDDHEASDDQRRELSGIVRDETRRLNAVLQNFLKWTRPAETHREVADLNATVYQVVELYDQTLNRERRHEITFAPEPTLAQAFFDPDQIRQVVWNLLLNSAEAMGSDGQIIVGTSVDEDWIYITVKDTGPGIQGSREKLFAPFFTTKSEGTGLGLALVRRIANAHGGWVTLENARGVGAEVVFAMTREDRCDGHSAG